MNRELTGNWIPFEESIKILFKSKTSKSICSELNKKKNFLKLILKAIKINTSTSTNTWNISLSNQFIVHCEMKFIFVSIVFRGLSTTLPDFIEFLLWHFIYFSRKLKEKVFPQNNWKKKVLNELRNWFFVQLKLLLFAWFCWLHTEQWKNMYVSYVFDVEHKKRKSFNGSLIYQNKYNIIKM